MRAMACVGDGKMVVVGMMAWLVGVVTLPMCASAVIGAPFPASSWVTYAELDLGRGPSSDRLTFANFTLQIPDSPHDLYGAASPGWYLGVVSADHTDIIRSVMAWAVDRPQFTVFEERSRRSDRYWWQSAPGHVLPGDTVVGNISLGQSTCNLTLHNVLAQSTIHHSLAVDSDAFGKPHLFLVMEHAPNACSELPRTTVSFTDIHVAVNGEQHPLVASAWTLHQPDPNPCGIALSTHANGSRISFTWPPWKPA